MLCSNCGKDIPFTGNVCPYCKADKSKDQQQHALAMVLGAIGGIIGAAVGNNAAPCVGAFVGGFIGMVVGVILGMVLAAGQPDSRPAVRRPRLPPPARISYHCPHCRTALESPGHTAGETSSCPSCNRRIQVPFADEPIVSRQWQPPPPDAPEEIKPAAPPPAPWRPRVTTTSTTYRCPHCHTVIESPGDAAGKMVSCPTCNRYLYVPG